MDLVDGTGIDADAILDFPIVYASAKAGRASLERPADGAMPDSADLEPLFRTILATVPAPVYDPEVPLQAHVTNLDASPFLGRLALCRVHNGTIKKGQQAAWCRRDGSVAARQGHRTAHDRGARAGAGRGGRPGRHHRCRRHPRDHHRRDPGRPGGPAPAAAHHRRRAGHLDDDRRQQLADGRPGQGHQGHRPAGQGPARPRARRQRLDPGAADRAPRHVGGSGPRRAGAGDPGRDDASRGLRAHRRQAAGGHAHDRRQAARAVRAADDRRAGGVPGHGHAAARGPQGPDGADEQSRHRLGADGVPGALAWPHRLPHRVPHRHPGHGHRPPRVRALRAVGRASCARGRPARWSPTAPARRPRSPSPTCRSAARSSSSRPPRCTRA